MVNQQLDFFLDQKIVLDRKFHSPGVVQFLSEMRKNIINLIIWSWIIKWNIKYFILEFYNIFEAWEENRKFTREKENTKLNSALIIQRKIPRAHEGRERYLQETEENVTKETKFFSKLHFNSSNILQSDSILWFTSNIWNMLIRLLIKWIIKSTNVLHKK
jgi:hypothetical protein